MNARLLELLLTGGTKAFCRRRASAPSPGILEESVDEMGLWG
jgi:hypothetical protein